jgi:hypothetical protein
VVGAPLQAGHELGVLIRLLALNCRKEIMARCVILGTHGIDAEGIASSNFGQIDHFLTFKLKGN